MCTHTVVCCLPCCSTSRSVPVFCPGMHHQHDMALSILWLCAELSMLACWLAVNSMLAQDGIRAVPPHHQVWGYPAGCLKSTLAHLGVAVQQQHCPLAMTLHCCCERPLNHAACAVAVAGDVDVSQTNDDDAYFHSGSLQHGGSSSLQRGDSSNSSSASLSSPGLSSCTNHQEAIGPDHAGPSSSAAVTGDAAWDSGPAGITFAEPVTTPTKGSQHGDNSELKPSLSRVESLSNSFIEEFESVDGGAGGLDGTSRQESEAGSIAGDLGTPPRRSRGDACSSDAGGGGSKQGRDSASDVIDLSPPSPPPDCADGAGFDLSNIFELGLRASSRTSSVDVLQGSMRCWSEPDLSEGALFGQPQQLDTGRTWASYSAGNSGCGSNASSRAGSSLGIASLGAPGGLVLRPRQSAGASRLQSSSQHDPEVEDSLELQPPQQQEQDVQQLQAVPEQEHPGASIKQQQAQQQQQQQQDQVDDSLLVLSPTQQPDGASMGKSSQLNQQQASQEHQQQQQGGIASDSSSSSSTAGPVTPTAPCGDDAPAVDAAVVSTAAKQPLDDAGAILQPLAEPSADAVAASAGEASPSPSPAAAEEMAPAAADSTSPSSPPAAAAGSGGGGGGFGFTFPTTPPSAVDAAVHEERAERVFSTWASNHSRSLSGALDLEFAACGEDAEGALVQAW